MWFKVLRAHFWEVRNPGERYSMLRTSKNRLPEFKGKFTIEEVSARTQVLGSRIRQFESGVELPDVVITQLVKDLDMTLEQFNSKTNPKIEAPKQEEPKPIPAKQEDTKPTSPKQEAPKTEAKSSKITTVVNHTEHPIMLKIEGDQIHIFDDDETNRSKGTWIAGADVMFGGTKRVPRVTKL